MIKCKWRELNQMVINIDGQVYPCCYLVNNDYQSRASGEKSGYRENQHIMHQYDHYKDDLNIFKNDFDSINEHPWWDELIESWSKDKALRQCKRWCTVEEESNE